MYFNEKKISRNFELNVATLSKEVYKKNRFKGNLNDSKLKIYVLSFLYRIENIKIDITNSIVV